jgi:hypothetical protein
MTGYNADQLLKAVQEIARQLERLNENIEKLIRRGS